jgi:hypothetical protein
MSQAAESVAIPTATATKWGALGYVQVRGLADRKISRFLRAQRKNMRRFFASQGYVDLLEQLEQIRRSRQGMMAKNVMFQKVMNEYIARNQPAAVPQTTNLERGVLLGVPVPDPEAGLERSEPALVDVQRAEGMGLDAGAGVQELANPDAGSEVVIEE